MHITYDQALATLQEIVAQRGHDWVYPSSLNCPNCETADTGECEWHYAGGCRYFTASGEPACLVGAFFDKTLDHQAYLHFRAMWIEGDSADHLLSNLEEDNLITVDERTRSLLIIAQGEQDSNSSWGDALQTAITQTKERLWNVTS